MFLQLANLRVFQIYFTCIHCDTITPSTLDCGSVGVVGHEKLLDSKVISPEGFGLKTLPTYPNNHLFSILQLAGGINREMRVTP